MLLELCSNGDLSKIIRHYICHRRDLHFLACLGCITSVLVRMIRILIYYGNIVGCSFWNSLNSSVFRLLLLACFCRKLSRCCCLLCPDSNQLLSSLPTDLLLFAFFRSIYFAADALGSLLQAALQLDWRFFCVKSQLCFVRSCIPIVR